MKQPTVDRVEWEMQLIDFDETLLTAIGFVEYPNSIAIGTLSVNFLSKEQQCSLYIDDDIGHDQVQILSNKKERNLDLSLIKVSDIKREDRFRFSFDCKKRQCDVYYNDKWICTLAKDLQKDIQPAIACYDNHEWKCTKWEYQ